VACPDEGRLASRDVHGEDLVDLRDQLIVHLRREEMGLEQRQL
jgi:hypothetical protein